MRRGVLVLTLAGLVSTGVACSGEDDLGPGSVTVVDGGTLEVQGGCGRHVTVDVSESPDTVRLDNYSGDAVDGDCASRVMVELDEPLGRRAVIVDGVPWQRVSGEQCQGDFSPPSPGLPDGCEDAEGESTPPGFETYTNSVDGITMSYPRWWYQAEAPLALHRGAGVEILGLTTAVPPAPEAGCSPYPWSAMSSLGQDDMVVTLRVTATSDGVGLEQAVSGEQPHDVSDLGELAGDLLPGGCSVAGVRQWSSTFGAHDRVYTVFVASRGELSVEREDELGEVLSSLQLEPIAEPHGDAVVGTAYWQVLGTHCGIRAASFNGQEWVVDPPLTDSTGSNPPSGWDNPEDVGVMTLVADDRAEFRSRDGQRVVFRPRTPADPPLPPCD